MPNNVIRQDYGSLGNDVQTQMLIAPVLAEMVSDRAYAVGEQFIVNNVLYKITQAVSAADVPLVVGNNCEVSDSITQQMNKNGTYNQTVGLIKASNGYRWISIFTGIKGTHTLTSVKEIKSGAPELVSNFTAFPTDGGLRAYTDQTTWDNFGLSVDFTIS